jgi:hypothetical protein
VPQVIATDKLRSYGVAKRHLLPEIAPGGAAVACLLHRQDLFLQSVSA